MTEFKQIIGRGTRINEDYDKYWFTIMDFKKATELFADPAFDGDPVMIYEPKGNESPVPPDDVPEMQFDENGKPIPQEPETSDITIDGQIDSGESEGRVKYVVGDVEVHVISERVQYYGPDGKLITESLKDFTRKAIRKDYQSLDQFLRRWSKAERKATILKELEQHGIFYEQLAEAVGKDYDTFDLICHVAFDQPPLTNDANVQTKLRNVTTLQNMVNRPVRFLKACLKNTPIPALKISRTLIYSHSIHSIKWAQPVS